MDDADKIMYAKTYYDIAMHHLRDAEIYFDCCKETKTEFKLIAVNDALTSLKNLQQRLKDV